jgi:hypothetical protein
VGCTAVRLHVASATYVSCACVRTIGTQHYVTQRRWLVDFATMWWVSLRIVVGDEVVRHHLTACASA